MTFEKVRNLIAQHLDMKEEETTETTTFEDLGVDSLDTVEILMEMEDEFGILITPGEVGNSIIELVKYIDHKLGN